MRIGKNPYKSKVESNKAYPEKKVLAAVVTFIPFQSGYYKDRFDLLKICLQSLIKNTPREDCDLLIMDQGSDSEVVDFLLSLKKKKEIDFLYLNNHNLGYNGALNYIYSIAQNKILSFSDDDVFYYKGWLESQLQILETYPGIGVVSGFPTKSKYDQHNRAAIDLRNKYQIDTDIVEWNWDWENDFLNSVGTSMDEFNYLENFNVHQYSYKGVKAFPVNTHFQYLITSEARRVIYPFKVGYNMSSIASEPEFSMIKAFDEKLDKKGFAKLATIAPTTEHMGNILTDRIQKLAQQLLIETTTDKSSFKSKSELTLVDKMLLSLMTIPLFSKLMKYLHGKTFELINKKKQIEKGR